MQQGDRGATPVTRTFDKANRMNDWGIVNTNTLHDLAGNQVKIPSTAGLELFNAADDHLNRLRTIKTAMNQGVATFEYDALGRRILKSDDKVAVFSRRYYYDGVNEIMEAATDDKPMAWFVHGVGYIDERLYMYAEHDAADANEVEASYYYAVDRMYDVRYLLDATGAIVESYSYDPYGKPLIRECAGTGDMTGDSVVDSADWDRFVDASNCNLFDPRADLDGDGVVGFPDDALFDVKAGIWDGGGPSPVRMARSLVGNPYMFQGRPNFVFDTDMSGEAADAELTLNDHRNRFADPTTGRWLTRDPIFDIGSLFEYSASNTQSNSDPLGLLVPPAVVTAAPVGGPIVLIGVAGGLALEDYLLMHYGWLGKRLQRDQKKREERKQWYDKQAKRHPKPPEPRRDPGRCTKAQRDGLQQDVDRFCDVPRKCTEDMSCAELANRIRLNQNCSTARDRINNTCYPNEQTGRGGDDGHQQAANNARRAEAKCWIIFGNNGCDPADAKNVGCKTP